MWCACLFLAGALVWQGSGLASAQVANSAVRAEVSERSAAPEPVAAAETSPFEILHRRLAQQAEHLERRLTLAASEAERQALLGQLKAAYDDHARQCVAQAARFPGSPAAVTCLREVAAGRGAPADAAFAALAQHYWESPGVAELALARVASGDSSLETGKLLNRLAEHHKQEATRARATLGVALWLTQRSELTTDAALAEQRERMVKESQLRLKFVLARHAHVLLNAADHEGGATLGQVAQRELNALKTLAIGAVAPEIEGLNAAGNRMRLSDFRGRVVVLHFFAEWCATCMSRTPEYRKLVRSHDIDRLVVLGVSLDDSAALLREAEARHRMTWQNWHSGTAGPIAQTWNVRQVPAVYVLDRQGVIRYKHVAGLELEKALQSLLGEPVAPPAAGKKTASAVPARQPPARPATAAGG